jgi:hypothetical protein
MTDVERMRDALEWLNSIRWNHGERIREHVEALLSHFPVPQVRDGAGRDSVLEEAAKVVDARKERWRLECEDATEKFAKAMYLRGVHDGLKHGPIVTRWDIPPHLIRDWIKDTGIALSPPSRDGK